MSLKNICLRFIVPFIMMLLGGVLYAPKAEATCTALGCNCVVAATPVSFGAYDAQSLTPLDGVGNVLVTCTALLLGGEVSYEIQINEGGAGSFSPRQLSSGASTLDYNLYTNSARSLVWGDGNAGTSTVSDGYGFLLLLVEERSYTVFGRVPTAQLVSSGTYTDSLTVTIVF